MMELLIRQATTGDAAALAEIYQPYIEEYATSFESEVPSANEFARRIESSLKGHDWIVGTLGHDIVGYAYGTTHRARAAYRFSVETSIYLDTKFGGKGFGKQLYSDLLRRLSKMEFHNAYAGITLPNPASVALHESLGFAPIGVFKEIGFKFDRWHDVGWWQKKLQA